MLRWWRSMHDLHADAALLRELHQPGKPVIFANVWDAASAKVVAQAGAKAIATSSIAVANAAGLNGRIDMFLPNRSQVPASVEAAIERGLAYLAAGADCIYPIFLADEAIIRQLTKAFDGRLNVLARPGAPSVKELGEIGITRI